MLNPARNVVEIQHRAMANATGQKDSAKVRVQVSVVEDTMLTPARNVVNIQYRAMANATGGHFPIQEGIAEGRVQVSIVEGTKLTPARIVVNIQYRATVTATGTGQISSAVTDMCRYYFIVCNH